jgi:hypothetical protein
MRLRLVRTRSDSDCGQCTAACVTGEAYEVVQFMVDELACWTPRWGLGTANLRVLIETITCEKWAVCRPDPYPTMTSLADDPRVSTPHRVVLLIRRTGGTCAHFVTYSGRRRTVFDNELKKPCTLEAYPHRRWRVLRATPARPGRDVARPNGGRLVNA